MTSYNFELINRLERAEHLVRADAITNRLMAEEYTKKAEQLREQADLLYRAHMQLWKIDRQKTDEGED